VSDFFYKRGLARAALDAGCVKLAAEPEMGDAMYSTISSATGDAGGERMRTNESPHHQANTAMNEHDRHVVRDPHNDAHVFPAGVQQSHNTRLASSTAMGTARTLARNDDVQEKVKDLEFVRRLGLNAAMAYPKVKDSSPVPVEGHELAKRVGGGAFLNRDHADLPKSPSIIVDPDDPNANILAHEIGHAKFEETPLGKLTQHPAARLSQIAAPPTAFMAGRYLPHGTKALGVGAAALGLSAPTLISEGMADYGGYQHLKELGATDEDLSDYVKDLILPQSSYLAMPLIAGGVGALGAAGGAGAKVAAAYKLHARRKFRNLNISIENRKGSVRKWYDPHEDRAGETVQRYPYGYIRMTKGMDGDHVDCYVGPHENAKNVYVVTTNKPPKFTEVDEQKCMLGFSSATAARKAFAQHYDKPGFFRSMKAIKYEDFERKVLATLHSVQKKVAGVNPALLRAGQGALGGAVVGGAGGALAAGEGNRLGGALLGGAGGALVGGGSGAIGGNAQANAIAIARAVAKGPPNPAEIAAASRLGRNFTGAGIAAAAIPGIGYGHKWGKGGGPAYDAAEARLAKAASNRFQSDDDRLVDVSPGTTHNQVPGDHLGLPHSSLVGMRSIKGGNPEDPSDTIDRMFRFHDNPMSSRVLEGNSSALPESPGV